jgi:hypothetical protein
MGTDPKPRATRPSKRFATLLVVMLFVGAGAALTFVDARTPAEVAADWAATEVARGTLPVTLDQVAALPEPYRRATFMAMTPAQRSAVWQERFARIASWPSVTAEQRALLSEYRSHLTPALYDLDNPNRTQLQLGVINLCPKMQELFFADSGYRWALNNLGPPRSTPFGSTNPLSFFLRATLRTLSVRADFGDCECNSVVGACDCNAGEVCKNLPCTTVHLNCGCGGTAVDCNRECDPPVID